MSTDTRMGPDARGGELPSGRTLAAAPRRGHCPPRTVAATVAIVAVWTFGAGCESSAERARDAVAVDAAVTVAAAGASHPTVAVEPAGGTAYAAWVGQAGDGEWNVYLASRVADAPGFSEPVRVNQEPGDAAPHAQAPAQVAVGPVADIYVVWQATTEIAGRRFPASDLRIARSTDGGRTFSRAVYVNDDAGGEPTSHTFHDVAVAGDGTVYVSWIDGRNDETDGPQIRVARSEDGGRTFSHGTIVDGGACPCCRTSLALGRDGDVYVAWRKIFEGGIRDIVVARSTDGAGSFSGPTRVHEDGWAIDGCPHAGPSVAVDRDGRVHVAWYTGAEERTGLFHAVAPTGGLRFGAARPLLDADFAPPSQARLATDARAGVWVAWEQRTGDGPRIRLGRVAPGAERVVGLGAIGAGHVPAIAAGADGALVAWLSGDVARTASARIP